ncbi:hypothetical protein D3C72_1990680 [compost metagenome]
MDVLPGQTADRSVVDVYLSAGQFIEADEQIDQRRFAGAGRTDDGDLLPRLNLGREVLDDRMIRALVSKLHMLELHFARCSFQLYRLLALIGHFLGL